jgi:hypothetical protein
VGEGREIAGGADGPLRRDHRQHALAQDRDEKLDGRRLHARGAVGEARRLQRQDQPDDRLLQRLADAGLMGADDVDLQLRQLLRRDADAGELAEAGVDAIDRVVAPRLRHQELMAPGDGAAGGGIEGTWRRLRPAARGRGHCPRRG